MNLNHISKPLEYLKNSATTNLDGDVNIPPVGDAVKPRFKILDRATEAVTDRENYYGAPEDNYERQAALANVVLASKLKGELSAADMILLHAIAIKGARLINQPDHEDSQVDMAGDAAILAEVV